MKTLTLIIILTVLCYTATAQSYERIEFNPYKKKIDNSLIIACSMKAIGFGLMSYACHKERQVLYNDMLPNPNNLKIYNTGLFICTISLTFDINYLIFKKNPTY